MKKLHKETKKLKNIKKSDIISRETAGIKEGDMLKTKTIRTFAGGGAT